MGLETEKADVQLFMEDDAYSHHSGVDFADPEKFTDAGSDRDPHGLNSHLKVRPKPGLSVGRERLPKARDAGDPRVYLAQAPRSVLMEPSIVFRATQHWRCLLRSQESRVTLLP